MRLQPLRYFNRFAPPTLNVFATLKVLTGFADTKSVQAQYPCTQAGIVFAASRGLGCTVQPAGYLG